MSTNAVLFIDANRYLQLYGLVAGKKLLDSLEEQRDHIFITTQIVDEVLRNKLSCALVFMLDKFKEIEASTGVVPDHLFGISDEKMKEFRNGLGEAAKVKTELNRLAADALTQISRSEDEVSRRLAGLFGMAILPSAEELRRARDRKERGNPPGKPNDPLGDQVTWEQLLSCCKDTDRLWIITKDKGYQIEYKETVLLNPLLYRDITSACGKAPDVHCFSSLLEGLKHFGKNAGVKAEKLPTEEESTEIKKEIDALPPLAWMLGTNNATMTAIRSAYPQRAESSRRAAMSSMNYGRVLPPPDSGYPEE
jgi:PIN domain